MTTTSHTAPKAKGSSKKSQRLLIIATAVALLVALPILPLSFLVSPAPPPDFFPLTRLTDFVLGRSAPPGSPPAPTRGRPLSHHPSDKVTLLDKAAQQLLLKIANSPSDPSLENRLGLVYFSLGEIDKAQIRFVRAVELSRTALLALEKRQKQLEAAGETSALEALILEESRLNIELSAAHSNLARLFDKLGERDKVVSELDALNREGTIQTKISTARVMNAKDRTATVNPVVARLLGQAGALIQSGRYEEAMDKLKGAIAVDPNLALAHHELGLAAAMTGNTYLAVEELNYAIRLDPADAICHNNLGLTYQTLGEEARAEEEFKQALALDPKLTDAALNLGNLYSARGRHAQARAAFEKAVLGSPQSAIAHNHLAAALSLEGKHKEAISEFRRAIALAPNMASAHYGLGLALFQAKQYVPAAGEFKRALMLNPSLTAAHDKIQQATRRASFPGGAYGFN